MAGHAAIRAADADRESVAERLRQASAEGRLLTDELEERLEAAFSARTCSVYVPDGSCEYVRSPRTESIHSGSKPAIWNR